MVIVGVRNPGQQINYGTGKDVSEETIANAGEPLTIRWSNRSYLDLPVWRPRPGGRQGEAHPPADQPGRA
jgi:uncharacterized protein